MVERIRALADVSIRRGCGFGLIAIATAMVGVGHDIALAAYGGSIMVALMGAMLNSLDRFTAAAAAPILLNLCLIGALLGLTPLLPSAGHALAWGTFAAGIGSIRAN